MFNIEHKRYNEIKDILPTDSSAFMYEGRKYYVFDICEEENLVKLVDANEYDKSMTKTLDVMAKADELIKSLKVKEWNIF